MPRTRAIASLLCALTASCAAKREPGFDLVFGSGRSNGGDVYRLDPDSGATTALTSSPKPDFNPRWDPARQRVVFSREVAAGAVVSHAIDGDGESELFPMPGDEDPVDWSPAGEIGVYAATVEGNRDLYLLEVATGAKRRLTTDLASDNQPRFSFDGAWIAFASVRSGGSDIWRIRPDGSDLEQLTDTPFPESHPSFSHDGRAILCDAFGTGETPDGLPDVFVVDVGTRARRNLTKSKGMDMIARWSPDGAWIAFGSNRDGDWDLYRVRPDGSELQQLTDDPAFDGDPNWIPRRFLGR